VLPEQHPDHSLGHRALQLAWTLSASRPSDLVSGRVMHLYSLTACHWTEPLEQALAQARLARAKLAAVGSFDSACFTRLTSQSAVLDTARHLDEATHETLASQREARRLDNPDAPAMFWGFRHFVRTLRGCEFHDVDADPRHTDPDPQPSAANDRPVDRALACTYQAIGAALFNDAQALQAHAAALRPLLSSLAGLYPETLARLALVLSGAARSFGETCEGDSELDEHMRWFAERAAGMPANFAHLHDFVQARSAAAAGRLREAMALFEQAIQAAHAQRRPWHHAFITEQAAHLHIERGLHSTGIDLLRRARSAYRRWGALAKVAQLTRRWPQLDASGQPGGAQGLQDPAIDIDCIALRDASRAIAGETETDRLIARITDVIARVSGSTEACLLCRDADEGWLLVVAARDGEPAVSLHCDVKEAVGHGFALPLIRYASRTLRTELIEDAHSDPRFAPSLRRTSAGPSDPAGTQPSSVLLMPLSSPTGERHAVLLLRNRLVPRFFTPRHIETLSRVTTALSAAIANAQLMRALKRRAAARSHESVQAASELLLRTRALDASTHGVMITDVSSGEEQVIYVNPHFEKSTGYSSDEFRRMGPRVLHARDDRQPALKVLWQAVADKKSCRVLLRNYRSDGEMFWSETSLAPVIGGSGQITHLVSTHVDVTPRVQAETALRLRTERLRAVFDFSPDGFVVLDAGQRVTSVNPAFEAMTGLLASDLLGLDLAGFEERLDGLRVAQPAESPRDILHLHLRSPVPAVLRRRVRQASDSGQETVMFFRDVTQEVETDRIKSEFLATAAHELRTPMTSVFGFSELLLTRRWSIALRHELLQTIHRQSAMLSGLINELLDLARIETGGWGGLDVQRHALQPVIRRAVDSQLAVHGGREVVMTLPDDPVWLRMDAAKMEVAISNALSNALKYSVGPVTVELLEP
ncbi:MAG: histidine kinase, partial [Rhizobacter sp.]|nr:histidine kinase [Rhizobacter sp.]